MEDRLESYFDRKTFCSDRILKHSEEGLHQRETTLLFDAARGKSVLDERNLRNGETKHQETDSPACVTDVLSGIYYLGAQRLEPGAVLLFPVNDGGKSVDVTAFVEGREDVKTDAGTFHTVRVAAYSDDGPAEGARKSLGLVYRRCLASAGADALPPFLGNPHPAPDPPGEPPARKNSSDGQTVRAGCAPRRAVLLQPKAFAHQALEARPVQQVVGQFLAWKHRQCRRA